MQLRFHRRVSKIAQNLQRKDGIVRRFSRVLCGKTSLVFPASHARHFPTLLVLDSTLRSEDELENADSAKKIRHPRAPMG